MANAPIGIHSKHSNPGPSASVDIEIAYNYISDTGRNSILLNANFAYIHDNILGPRNASIRLAAANGNAGGDFNVLEHNTFFDTGVTLSTESGGSTDQAPGAYGNTLRDNVFAGSSSVGDAPSNSTTFDYNLYPAGTALSGLGENSIAGDAIFVNGGNPMSVDDYQLASSSPGAGQSSTGTDMGVRIDQFGQLVVGFVRPRAPTSLLIIQ